MKALHKVLNFIWCALSNCLPTMVMLPQKYVPIGCVCPVCRGEDDTIFHALVACPFAAQYWQIVIYGIQLVEEIYLFQWWEQILEFCNNNWRAEIATICWAIWKASNDLVWNKKQAQTNIMIASTKMYLMHLTKNFLRNSMNNNSYLGSSCEFVA